MGTLTFQQFFNYQKVNETDVIGLKNYAYFNLDVIKLPLSSVAIAMGVLWYIFSTLTLAPLLIRSSTFYFQIKIEFSQKQCENKRVYLRSPLMKFTLVTAVN